MEVLGIFRDVETAGTGVAGLITEGFVESQITSLSSVRYPAGVLVTPENHSWFRWLTLVGGVSGAGAGSLLAAGTAWLYPVQTGDKPIIALYPTGIIAFEIAMLFAIVGTMVGMLLEMKLPPRSKRLYDPAISDGLVGISVTIHPGGEIVTCREDDPSSECIGLMAALPAQEQLARAEEVMFASGALRVVRE